MCAHLFSVAHHVDACPVFPAGGPAEPADASCLLLLAVNLFVPPTHLPDRPRADIRNHEFALRQHSAEPGVEPCPHVGPLFASASARPVWRLVSCTGPLVAHGSPHVASTIPAAHTRFVIVAIIPPVDRFHRRRECCGGTHVHPLRPPGLSARPRARSGRPLPASLGLS